ncbi:M56 family metallopeptidase [Streptomyces nanhaiensis]|uniref:M56 family metallopeptidase n=1 Tax=Streptomyces nanhaiensis TaxID=679319 RepID=UPI00399D2771
MIYHLLPPLGIVLGAGVVAPLLLARARWAHHAPRLAIGAWLALAGALTFSGGLLLAQLLLSLAGGQGVLGLLVACTAEPERIPADRYLPVVAAVAAVTAAGPPCGALVREYVRTRRSRARHARILRLVGRRSARLGVTLLDHETPAVYCLPGRPPEIVVSSGAVSTLRAGELSAAVEHERAHLAGRHHLLFTAARALGSVYRRLPLGGGLRREVPLLLEMAADDRVLRRCTRQELAAALYETAAGQAPRDAFALGGLSAVQRMNRILATDRPRCPVARGTFTVLASALAVIPLLAACCSL